MECQTSGLAPSDAGTEWHFCRSATARRAARGLPACVFVIRLFRFGYLCPLGLYELRADFVLLESHGIGATRIADGSLKWAAICLPQKKCYSGTIHLERLNRAVDTVDILIRHRASIIRCEEIFFPAEF
jgi:hypothetical protein